MGDGKDPSMAGWKVSWMADRKGPAMKTTMTTMMIVIINRGI